MASRQARLVERELGVPGGGGGDRGDCRVMLAVPRGARGSQGIVGQGLPNPIPSICLVCNSAGEYEQLDWVKIGDRLDARDLKKCRSDILTTDSASSVPSPNAVDEPVPSFHDSVIAI